MRVRGQASWLPRICKLSFALALACLFAGIGAAQSDSGQSSAQGQSAGSDKSSSSDKKDKNEPPTTRLRIEIVDPSDKPVGNASVYIRFSQPTLMHKDKLSELNLKTNEDGTVKVPAIPQGKILIQVIAKGWHTYGKWYDIEKDEDTIPIKLEAPTHWY
jgi:hypothetical protein